MVRTGKPAQVFDRIHAVDHVVVINVLQIAARRLFRLWRARAAAYSPALIKPAQVVREKAAPVEHAELEIGKAVENSAIGHEAERKGPVRGIAADEPETESPNLSRPRHVLRINDDQCSN